MMQKIINRIVVIIMLAFFVALDACVAMQASDGWVLSMCGFSASYACFTAWQCYNSAMRIAKELDHTMDVKVTIEKRPSLDTEPISLN